jgi:hypothetical protein
MARNRIIYGSQSVWCNGAILYRVSTLGSTTTFTSEDIFELGHLDIVDVVDDVPAVAITMNTMDWGDVQTMAVLAQVAPAKLVMTATADDTTGNLATVSGTTLTEKYYHHGVGVPDFAVTCGNLPGVSIWAPVQSECDLGTLANNIDQTMYMDEVFVNSLEFGYTTGANATENYGAETDQKMWLLNDGRFVNWEENDGAASITIASGVSMAGFSDGTMGFLRTDTAGLRGMTLFDASENTSTVFNVVSGTASAADVFTMSGFNPDIPTAGPYTVYPPSTIDGVAYTPVTADKFYALYAADGYTTVPVNQYFSILDDTERPDTIGAVRQGQVEIYLVSDSDTSYANAWRLTGVTITADLTREPLSELGHLGPYDRPLTVPVPITLTIDTTAGDLEHWSRFADRYSEFSAGTMDEIDLADLMASESLKLVVKVFAQTDEEAGGTGSNRTIATGSTLIGQDKYYSDANASSVNSVYAAGEREYALKTVIVEHIKITDEAYTLDLGTNATQTFGFRSTNDLYVVKGDLDIMHITDGNKIRRNAT